MSARKQPKNKKSSAVTQPASNALLITSTPGGMLSKAQIEFNRLMKSLEKARAKQLARQKTLDQALATCIVKVFPLADECRRYDAEFVLTGYSAMKATKLTQKCRHWFGDYLSSRANDLLGDSFALTDEVIMQLNALIADLGVSIEDKEATASNASAFDELRDILVSEAKKAGVDLDLSDLDAHSDPAELERMLRERLDKITPELEAQAAAAEEQNAPKQTKTQLEKQRKAAEIQEAKTRDLKTLYKQLAKALHPDLEPDPVLKVHKESWMKRLTAAYASMDLRELLQIEMEWLGEESANLANAGDEKLRAYCMLLKEQIHEITQQTYQIPYQPQYQALRNYIAPFQRCMPNWDQICGDIKASIHTHQLRIKDLNDPELCKLFIQHIADEHFIFMHHSDYPF